MSWLAERFAQIREAVRRHAVARAERRTEDVSFSDQKEARHVMMTLVEALVVQVADREGVIACVGAHDGLLTAGAGDPEELEGLAAMTQRLLEPSEHAAHALHLGEVDQILVSGSSRKLALLREGEVTIAILAPRNLALGPLLARPPAGGRL